jgi:catechol 2,3-dioxygenase-like lactoylglutathione lyase family enzyme
MPLLLFALPLSPQADQPAVFLRGTDQLNQLALLSAASQQTERAQSDAQSPQVDGIAHIALRVSDLERERTFLKSLGLEEAFAQTSGTTTTEVFFKVNNRQFIELYPPKSEINGLGLMHICYESDSLQQLAALYVSRGLPMSAVKKGGAGNLITSLHDPFGQEVEITQYLPGSRHFEDRGKHLGASRISDELQGIELPVPDIDEAMKFYTVAFGFEQWKDFRGARLRISSDADQWIALEAAGAGARPRLVFRVPNVKRAADQLRKKGLKLAFRKGSACIDDPDGNLFIFSEQ